MSQTPPANTEGKPYATRYLVGREGRQGVARLLVDAPILAPYCGLPVWAFRAEVAQQVTRQERQAIPQLEQIVELVVLRVMLEVD